MMKDNSLFINTIMSIQRLKKIKRTKDNIFLLDDSMHSKLLYSLLGDINPGVQRELVSALNILIPSLDKLRVGDYDGSIYICNDGKEGYIYSGNTTKLDRYLRLSKCDLGIKFDNKFTHYDLMTDSLDTVVDKKNSLVGTIMNYNKNGTEIYRSITEATKEESPIKFEKVITYERDNSDDTLIHVKRELISYNEGKRVNDSFNINIYHPDLDIILKNYHRDDIFNDINKGRTI